MSHMNVKISRGGNRNCLYSLKEVVAGLSRCSKCRTGLRTRIFVKMVIVLRILFSENSAWNELK